MADNKVVLEFEVKGNGEQKAQSLRAQMKALREELARLPEGTAEFNKVQRELGDLTDKVGDLSRGVNTLAGDPLERLNNSFGMIGSSILSLDFGAAQQGLQGVSSAVKDFKFGDLTKAAKGFGSTMLDLGKSLLTNPIFLIGAIIAAVVMNFDKLVNAGGLVGKMFGFIKETIDAVTGGLVDFLDYIGLTDSKAEERAENDKKRAEENKKLEEEKLKKQKEVDAEKEKLAKEAAAKEAARMQKVRDDQNQLTTFLKTEQEKRFQDTLSEQDKELRQLQLTYDEKKKLAHGNKDLLKQLEKEYQTEISVINANYEAKRNAAALEAAKKQKDLLKQIEEEALTEREALAQEIQNITQGEQATEIQNLRDSYFTKIELAKQYGLDSVALEEKLAQEEEAIREKYAVKEVESVKMTTEQKLQLAQTGLNGLMSLNDLLTTSGLLNAKQSFKINKSLQLAQAGIGAVQAVQNVLADPTLIGGSRFIAAAAAGVAGAANVAKIAAMKFNAGAASSPSSGGGSMGALGGGGGGGSTSAPALDLSFLNNSQTKAQPIQSYVLATNVTSAQDAQQKILDQSKLIK
jgi:hypothetical protein